MHTIPTELVMTTDRRFLYREHATPELLRAVGVDSEWSEYVRVLNQEGKLALLHYINTHKSAVDQDVDEESLRSIGHLRGVIVDSETGAVVCRSYPYTPEILSSDQKRLDELLPRDLSKATFFQACEGTVLRVFWFEDQWHISTHRKIDAANSSWSGPTFGAMFDELKQFDFEDLNKGWCYMFLMSHNGNRLVYPIPTGQLMLTAVYDQKKEHFLPSKEWGGLPKGVVQPTPVTGIRTMADILRVTNEFAKLKSFNASGLIVLGNECEPLPVKIINTEYSTVRDARGNDPNLRTRYILTYGSADAGLIVKWYSAEFQSVFDGVEDELSSLVKKLHSMYMDRYIRKNFEQIPKEDHVTLRRCHEWHTQDRRKNIVTAKKVKEIVDDTPNHFVLIMLNRLRKESEE